MGLLVEGMGLASNLIWPLSYCNYLYMCGFESHLAQAGLAANHSAYNDPKSSWKRLSWCMRS